MFELNGPNEVVEIFPGMINAALTTFSTSFIIVISIRIPQRQLKLGLNLFLRIYLSLLQYSCFITYRNLQGSISREVTQSGSGFSSGGKQNA